MTRLTALLIAVAAVTPAMAQDKPDAKRVAELKERIAAKKAELRELEAELAKLAPAEKPKDSADDPAKAYKARLEEVIKKFEQRVRRFAEFEAESRRELDAALEDLGVARRQLKAVQDQLEKLKAPAEKPK